MATLATTYSELRSEIGYYAGYGRTSGSWTSDQSANINAWLLAGMRQFLSPPPLDGRGRGHRWKFLRPLTTLTTTADQAEDDISAALGIIGPFYYDDADHPGYGEVQIVDVDILERLRNHSPASGPPTHAAIVPKPPASPQTSAQGWQIRWYPTPSAVYTLRYRYNLDPVLLDGTNTVPLGYTEHAQTLLASCIAAVEFDLTEEHGSKWQDFLVKLATSINLDNEVHTPTSLGRMVKAESHRRRLWRDDRYITSEYPT